MPRRSDKRERLLDSARELIHAQGFNQTTLADIAARSGVPLGNVYYYFRTKEELGAAVIAEHTAAMRERMQQWAEATDPRERLRQAIDFLEGRRDALAEHGCPVGSLCQELEKTQSRLATEADSILDMMLDWSAVQIRDLGHDRDEAGALAEQFIAQLQGIILLANARRDPGLISRQAQRLRDWLATL